MKLVQTLSIFCALVLAGLSSTAKAAVIYDVNRSFGTDATLTGTVEIPLGTYALRPGDASPFTSVDLTLTVGGSSFGLNNSSTIAISGGVDVQFNIEATSTNLTFDPMSPGFDFAFLRFDDGTVNTGYEFGSLPGGVPTLERAITTAGAQEEILSPPVVFATASTTNSNPTPVPEPTSLLLFGSMLGLSAIGYYRQRRVVSV